MGGHYRSAAADRGTPLRVLFAPDRAGRKRGTGGIGMVENVTMRCLAQRRLVEQNQLALSLAAAGYFEETLVRAWIRL